MPAKEGSVAAQDFEKMKSPLFEKRVRKADFIQNSVGEQKEHFCIFVF